MAISSVIYSSFVLSGKSVGIVGMKCQKIHCLYYYCYYYYYYYYYYY